MAAGVVEFGSAMLVGKSQDCLSLAQVLQRVWLQYLVHHAGHVFADCFSLLAAPGGVGEEKCLGFIRIVVLVSTPGARFVRSYMAFDQLPVQKDFAQPEGATHPDFFAYISGWS